MRASPAVTSAKEDFGRRSLTGRRTLAAVASAKEAQRLTQKATCLNEKTVRSVTAKKPVPVRLTASAITGDNKKVFFISYGS